MIIELGILTWIISGFIFLLSTLYFIFEMAPAYIRHRKSYLNPNIASNSKISELLSSTNQQFPLFKFQITTRGNELDAVKRGVKSIFEISENNDSFKENFELLVVTDEPQDYQLIMEYFDQIMIDFPSEVLVVPENYETTNKTKMKARSLQYSVEYRKKKSRQESHANRKSFVFYFDSESIITDQEFRRILHSVITQKNQNIFEGPIVYPVKYFQSNIFSRQMEAYRPFHCYHCAQVMKNPPPIHFHGSNLLVEESLVLDIGWDFGLLDGCPLLAEDLIFGLKVYLNKGKQPFGWHGGRLYEQPPITLKSSLRARIRWITGTWQAVKLIKLLPEFQALSWRQKFEITFKIRYRIIAHSLSFFSVFFILFGLLAFLFPKITEMFIMDLMFTDSRFLFIYFLVSRFIFLPGTLFWLTGIVIGALKNLETLPNLSRRAKFAELIRLLAITPIAATIESASAFYASIRWIIGRPYTNWSVTEK
jgi:hypothetical protein